MITGLFGAATNGTKAREIAGVALSRLNGGYMCDYSLGEIRSRLAVEGEELVVHRFPTHTLGLASPADLGAGSATCCEQSLWGQVRDAIEQMFGPSKFVPAVCVPPGATLVLTGIPTHLQRRWEVQEEEPVQFIQTSMEVNRHRDGIRFRNGHESLLQNLPEGLRVKIISLGGEQPEVQETRPVRESVGVYRGV
jgi:hypothetical protein